MSYVDSSSTDAEVRAAYADNASYDVTGDPAMARRFIVACRVLLQREPLSAGRKGNALVLDKKSVQDALEKAEDWLQVVDPTPVASTTASGSVNFKSFQGFRS